MCGTVNPYEEDDMAMARRLALLGMQLDECRSWLHNPEGDDALEIVEALYRRARELAGDRAEEIFGADEEETHS
ncbi:MAG: hypothetical protein PHH47_13005 [Gallionella sp.]|nr:hypothetical protein [Gallionella sp.]MDD4947607.1 hypothetical protein [Gallionella sp.]MDD5612451.1 hypothetical protein [Gallionella sp.]